MVEHDAPIERQNRAVVAGDRERVRSVLCNRQHRFELERKAFGASRRRGIDETVRQRAARGDAVAQVLEIRIRRERAANQRVLQVAQAVDPRLNLHRAPHRRGVAGEGADIRVAAGLVGGGEFDDVRHLTIEDLRCGEHARMFRHPVFGGGLFAERPGGERDFHPVVLRCARRDVVAGPAHDDVVRHEIVVA